MAFIPKNFEGYGLGFVCSNVSFKMKRGFLDCCFFLGFTFIYGVSIFLGAAINTIKLPWSGSFVPFLLSRWGWFCRWVYHMTICFTKKVWGYWMIWWHGKRSKNRTWQAHGKSRPRMFIAGEKIELNCRFLIAMLDIRRMFLFLLFVVIHSKDRTVFTWPLFEWDFFFFCRLLCTIHMFFFPRREFWAMVSAGRSSRNHSWFRIWSLDQSTPFFSYHGSPPVHHWQFISYHWETSE